MTIDRIDAISELYSLGREAQDLIDELEGARRAATKYRLDGLLILAGWANNDAAMLESWLAKIGLRQQAIIDQLQAAGEIIYL